MRRRILQSTLLAVAVTALALGLPLGFTAFRLVQNKTISDLDTRVQQITAEVDDQLSSREQIDIQRFEFAVPPGGQLVINSRATGLLTLGAEVGPDAVTRSAPVVDEGTVSIRIPREPTRSEEAQVTGLVVLVALLSVGVGAMVAIVTARRLSEPLRGVADRAARLGAGDFRRIPERYGIPELDRVSDALDSSARAVAELLQRERELVGDVSHQLRSRLTALQLRLETLSEHPDAGTAREARAALEQAERLSEVLDELLATARAAREGSAEPLDLTMELPAIAAEWRETLRAEGRTLRLRVADGLIAKATPGRLREAIGVLLDNALRHGEGAVGITAWRTDGTIVIEVHDSGQGVPAQLVEHVFERGVSGGGSTGVGLALARALVEADGGRLKLASTKPATFSIFLRVPNTDDLIGASWRPERTPR